MSTQLTDSLPIFPPSPHAQPVFTGDSRNPLFYLTSESTRRIGCARVSCMAVMCMRAWYPRHSDHAGFFASRDIEAGEELTYSYNYRAHNAVREAGRAR
jgi:hypothetical protein